ncbi:carboxypeptidase regulatory-like domain-containing protein [Larkinella bovis]|uniref:Carboxypeptidase regulatory-like domain-containing protein n=1 Tax=Larkinella bovis TaxID=683041 RepID=A0ABW0ICU0_9BACT
MKKLLSIGLLLLLVVSALGQSLTQTIKGIVTDVQSGQGLPGATVVLVGSNPLQGAISDAEGLFEINRVPVGRQTLLVTYIGYRDQTVPNILVTTGKEVMLTVSLQEDAVMGQEVVVKARHDDQLNNEFGTLSARTFDIEQTRRFAGSRNDPARMAANFAGVQSNNDSRNDIVVRGNSPTGLLWRLEGVDIFNPNHYGALGATGGPVSMLNNNLLAKSDFFTGAFPATYGNAVGGVFDLQLRTGNRSKREYTGQVGFNGFEIGAEGPFVPGKKATYLVHYRYSVLAAVKALNLNVGTGSAVPKYQDLSFKIDLPTGRPGNRVTIFGIGGQNEINFVPEASDTNNAYNDAYANTYNQGKMAVAGASYTHYLTDRTYLKATLAASYAAFQIREDSLNQDRQVYPFFRDNSRQQRVSAIVQYNQKFNARHTLAAGLYAHRLFFQYIDSLFVERKAFRTRHDFNGNSSLFQGYVQWQYKPSNRLTVNTGLNGTFFALNNRYAVEPRLSLRYELAARQVVSFGAGLHSQLQPYQLYFYQTRLADGQLVESNRDLDLTRSFQGVIGYERTLGENVRLKAEAYYQYLFDVPVEKVRSSYSALNFGATFATPGAGNLINAGKGRNYGLELTAERAFQNGYYFLTTVSLYESKYQGSDAIWRNTAFNGKYVANVLAGREFRLNEKNALSLDMRTTVAGGRRYTPIDLAKSIEAGDRVDDQNRAFAARYKDYFRTDLKLTFRHNGRRATQEWFVDLQNIFNTKNVFQQVYDSRAQRIRTQYQLGFFPNFNYRIEF